MRSQPHIYSAICKARLAYSRYLAGWRDRVLFRENQELFSMSPEESRHCETLRRQGYAVLADFFDTSLIDSLFVKADRLLRSLHVDPKDAYSIQNRQRTSLEGLSYEELAASEKMIAVRDPLLSIPELLPVALHESILKIVTNFLGYIVPWFKPTVVRDFPADRPRESSNFHRDNDEADSVQAFVYLVDIDDTRGPLVYVPGTDRYDVRSCRPRLARDLGISGYDGRISDEEIEKHYPRDSWSVLRVKRGSVAIIHGNGFHKGPSWPVYGDSTNQPRSAVKLDFNGYKLGKWNARWKGVRIRTEDYSRLTPLQRLFTDEEA
jgi:ectoine hydroxylase-related dioxygenase (phytanoyl-CoA dioxygenase family)